MGVKIDIWAVGASSTPDYALWKFVKNANGTYRILSKCSNDTRAMVVQGGSTDSGASVIQYSYNDTTNEMWVLESAKKGTATLNGSIQEDGLDRTSWLPNTAAATRDMGYSTITYQNPTAATAFTQLKNSSIWAVRAHGNSNGVLFYGGNKDSWLDCEMLSTLPYYSLYRNRMVVYAMCRGGSGGNSAYNIVNLTYQKGAKCVIGFEYTIVYTHANRWIYEFFYSSKNGKTVKQACNDADYWTGVYLASHGSTDFRLVRGNTAQHLTE